MIYNDVKNDKPFDVFRILGHPFRRRLLATVASHSVITITDLFNEIETTPGNCYFHLDILKSLIKRDANNALILTDMGFKAVDLIIIAKEKGLI